MSFKYLKKKAKCSFFFFFLSVNNLFFKKIPGTLNDIILLINSLSLYKYFVLYLKLVKVFCVPLIKQLNQKFCKLTFEMFKF